MRPAGTKATRRFHRALYRSPAYAVPRARSMDGGLRRVAARGYGGGPSARHADRRIYREYLAAAASSPLNADVTLPAANSLPVTVRPTALQKSSMPLGPFHWLSQARRPTGW